MYKAFQIILFSQSLNGDKNKNTLSVIMVVNVIRPLPLRNFGRDVLDDFVAGRGNG